jgi:hypothetical protein
MEVLGGVILVVLGLAICVSPFAFLFERRRWRRYARDSDERMADLKRHVSFLETELSQLREDFRAFQERFAAREAAAPSIPVAEQAKPAPPLRVISREAPKVTVSPPPGSATAGPAPAVAPGATPAGPVPAAPVVRPPRVVLAAPEGPSLKERLRSALAIEEVLGANWLNKIGIVVLVFGVAFFLSYQLRQLGPADRVLVGYTVSGALLGSGLFFERRDRYRILARAGIGGGWALLFFTTYAMHHVPAAKVIASQAFDLVLLLVVAAAMIAHTLRYRSQVVTALAFFLALSTVTISRSNMFSLSASAILVVGLAVVAARMRWFELEVFGLLATYLNHYYWLRSIIEAMGAQRQMFPEYPASAALLLFYWAAFRASYLVRRVEDRHQENVSTAAALLNTLLLLAVMRYQSVRPALAFWFLLGVGAVETLLGQLRLTRQRRTAVVILSIIGIVLLIGAFPLRFSGAQLSVLWLVSAAAVFLAGVFTREIVFRRLGMLAAVLAAGHLLAVDAARVLGARLDGADMAGQPLLAALFALAALFFYGKSHIVLRRWPHLFQVALDRVCLEGFSYGGGVLAVVGAWVAWPGVWTAVAWAALGLSLAIAANRLALPALSFQAHLMALGAVLRVLTVNLEAAATYQHITLRLITVSLVAALLYLSSRWSPPGELRRFREIPAAYTWAASALVGLLIWYELQPAGVALGWSMLGLILFESGLERRSTHLRLQGYAALAAGFLRIFYVNFNAEGIAGELSPRFYTTLPLAGAFYYVYWQLENRRKDSLQLDRRLRVFQVCSYLGTLTLVAMMRFELDLDWVAAAWAALVLLLLMIAWRTGRTVFFGQGLLLSLAVLFRTAFHNFYERSGLPSPWLQGRLLCVGTTIALLFICLLLALQRRGTRPAQPGGQHWFVRMLGACERYPEQLLFFIILILSTVLLALAMAGGMVTVAWGLQGVAVFLFALWAQERSFRLAGLGLLLLCVGKIAFWDAWGLDPRDRYLTFIVLGSALLSVSFVYTRYRERIRAYL